MTRGEALLEALKARSNKISTDAQIDEEFNAFERKLFEELRDNQEVRNLAKSYIERGLGSVTLAIPEFERGIALVGLGWAAAERFYFEQIAGKGEVEEKR